MKTLNNYINEWKASADNVSSIKTQYFIYELKVNKRMKIFDSDWKHFDYYKNKVYMNGEQIAIGHDGWTPNEYEPGVYKFEIKDIDNVTNCQYMFFNCTNLVEAPLFDISKVENMYFMFFKCYNLSEKTKKEWSQIYDFSSDKQIK